MSKKAKEVALALRGHVIAELKGIDDEGYYHCDFCCPKCSVKLNAIINRAENGVTLVQYCALCNERIVFCCILPPDDLEIPWVQSM